MAAPLKTGKQTVNLASSGVKVSRIRRDPPPKVKVKEVDPDEVDRNDVVIGVLVIIYTASGGTKAGDRWERRPPPG